MSTKALMTAAYATIIVLIIGFAASTIFLYITSDIYRLHLSKTVRISGWTTYQAQLEYVRLTTMLYSCDRGGPCNGNEILVRAELLASRLDVLANSDEASVVPYLSTYVDRINAIFDRLVQIFDRYHYTDAFSPIETSELVASLDKETASLRILLQQLLRESTLYNESIELRENSLRLSSPTAPFIMLALSGLALIGMLIFHLRGREHALRQVQQLRLVEIQQQQETAAFIDSLPVPVFVVDEQKRVAFFNSETRNIFGSSASDISARMPQWIGILTSAEPPSVVSLTGEDGLARTFRYRLTGVHWNGHPAFLVLLLDTALDGNAHLAALGIGKMVLLGELSSAIVHELSQPLMTISVAARNAGKLLQAPQDGPVSAKLERIQEQVERISRIVANVRRLAAPIATTEAFFIRTAVEAAIQMAAFQYKQNSIKLIVDDHAPDARVQGNSFLLELGIVNILQNAKDAFRSGKSPAIGERTVRITITADSNCTTIEAEDNAGGIDKTVIDHVFDSFVTSRPQDGGMGIGLSITRRAVESMNGTIIAENIRCGARITIRLPTDP